MQGKIKNISDSTEFCKWNVEIEFVLDTYQLSELLDKSTSLNKFIEMEAKDNAKNKNGTGK